MSWAAPALLAALLAVGLPLWLHRFARETQQRRLFASLMLIDSAPVQRSRQRQLRYWLLLALRVALLIAIVLAFAGPRCAVQDTRAANSGARLHVIVLDTSLSMQAGDRWAAAQSRAKELVGSLGRGDRVMLVAADHRLRVLQEPVFEAQAGSVTAAIDALRPGLSRLDYGMLGAGVAALTGKQEQPVVLHLITDLQRSASPLRFADLQPPAGATLDLVNVGEVQVTSLRVDQVAPAERDANVIEVQLGGDPAVMAGRELTLSIDGVERGRRRLVAATALPWRERFETGDLGAGEHRIAAYLSAGDALAQDDAGFALLRRLEPRVLLVTASAGGDDAAYFDAALQSLGNPRFKVEQVVATSVTARALNDYAAVVVSDAGILGEPAATAIAAYARRGGAVVMTLGPRSVGLKTVPVTGQVLASGAARQQALVPTRVATVEQSHPALREPASWRSIRFFRYVAVAPATEDRVLVALESGAPLLLERQLGSGRALTLTSPLNRDWNDLAIHPLFVRFVAEATAWLSGARADVVTTTVGTVVNVNEGAARGGAQVFDPQGRRALALEGTAAELRIAPEQTGFYEVRGGGRSDWVAVNIDPREADLGAMDAEAVARWHALGSGVSAGAAPGGGETALPGERVLPIWFWLLLAAALLAFFEPVVANYHLHVRRETAS